MMVAEKEVEEMMNLLLAVIYAAFISLGLPDAILGAAWPVMSQEFQAPVSWAGAVSMIICGGTVVSSLLSERLIHKLGTGKVTLISVAMTAVALAGFSFSRAFWMLCFWAVPYGLGAGSVDAALNNYVAVHYSSRHMSWLHCMWGLGASAGPVIMGSVLTGGQSWNHGYRYIALLQVGLTLVLLLTQPLWKQIAGTEEAAAKPLTFREILDLPGAKESILSFFCYCALENTFGLWASSYLVENRGLAEETAASWAAWFYTGLTIGRGVSGFLTARFNDRQMMRLGDVLTAAGLVIVLLPFPAEGALVGLVLAGFGCAPIYPSTIHATPALFGVERAQAMIGVQMAGAYMGTTLMPPLFGLLAGWMGTGLYPVYLLTLLCVMAWMHLRLRSMSRL